MDDNHSLPGIYSAIREPLTKQSFINTNRNTSMKISSIIATSLFLGAAGALAGVLFAPGKGSNTRRKISRNSNKYRDYISENIDDLADSVVHSFEDLEDQATRLSKKMKKTAKGVRS